MKETLAMNTLHDNGVEKYKIFVKNNIRMITSKSSSGKKNGIIAYILSQLKLSASLIFLQYIQDLHI